MDARTLDTESLLCVETKDDQRRISLERDAQKGRRLIDVHGTEVVITDLILG